MVLIRKLPSMCLSKDSIATWTYYTDFEKVYENVQKVKVELNILNSLIASKNIEKEFVDIVSQYPNVLKVVPVLLAKREAEIKVQDADGSYTFNFVKMNYTVDQYVLFMRNSGLFDYLQNHIINNLVDYVLGIEVGMDTNGRKNRTEHVMEDLVESYLIKAGLIKGKTYFKEMYASEVQKKFNIDLSAFSNDGKAEKRFDFVFVGALGTVFACECNFYSGGGSKLNETARSYKILTLESKGITGFQFVWFTDGTGWTSARHNLEETFDILDTLYNLDDLEKGAINTLVDPTKYLEDLIQKGRK
ncbi:MAG: type II restriction endonuclease [Candidatus Izemoplasmatales bacterium]|nr:type II restriction endonuclease [Candidatus Izemoplasmatales bacterium]